MILYDIFQWITKQKILNELSKKDCLKLVQNNGLNLKKISKKQRNDYSIVKEAIKQNPLSIRFVDPFYRFYRKVAQQAIKSNEKSFIYIDKTLQQDFQFLKDVIKYLNQMLTHINLQKIQQKYQLIKLIELNPKLYDYLKDMQKNDPDIIKICIQQNYFDFKTYLQKNNINPLFDKIFYICQFIFPILKYAKILYIDVIVLFLKNEPDLVQSFPELYKQDKQIILALLKLQPKIYQYLSPKMKNNLQNIEYFLQKKAKIYGFLDQNVQMNNEIFYLAIQQSGQNLRFAPFNFRNDPIKVFEAIKKDGYALEYASQPLLNDFDFIEKVVTFKGFSLYYAPSKFKKDRKIIYLAVKSSSYAMSFIDNSIKKDFQFMKQLVQIQPCAIKYLNFKEQQMIILFDIALKKNPYIIFLKKYKEFYLNIKYDSFENIKNLYRIKNFDKNQMKQEIQKSQNFRQCQIQDLNKQRIISFFNNQF